MAVLIFIAILLLLVVVHECGHFLAAKFFGIRVDEFGVGFPPKLFGVKRGETEYTVNALPIGGFVRIWGENAEDVTSNDPDAKRSFVHKPKWQQAIVLIAGIAFNIIFAWIVFSAGFVFGMPTAITEEERENTSDVRLLVTEVVPGSPASVAGMVSGDEIVGITSEHDSFLGELTPDDVSSFISENNSGEIRLVLSRGGVEHQISVVPEAGVIADEPDRRAAGFVMTLAGIITLPVHEAIIEGAKMTYGMTIAVAEGLGSFLMRVVSGNAGFNEVSGPVGIAGMVGDASALGFAYLVTFTAFISINLAVINLLPFPALDGGRLLFVAIEAITRKHIPAIASRALNTIGFLLLIGLMIAVTVSDVSKLL